jgi:hypothetical protein
MRLKVTVEEQGKMRQSIENKQKNAMSEAAITVMFRGRNVAWNGADSRGTRGAGESATSEALTAAARQRAPYQHMRTPTKAPIEKFFAGPRHVGSADLVSEICSNLGGNHAALITINQKTEQHRCVAV